MVARDVFLLVGIFVLLIHEDQPEVRQRRKHRGSRADDDARHAFADAVPLIEALALGEIRVQHGDLLLHAGEAGFEAADCLGRQGNFRDQNQHGFSEIERAAGGLQIDLGFARAGHA